MTRGRRPLIALGEAKHIAEKRGKVRNFRHEPDMICNFVIYLVGLVAHVRVRRVNRIRITPDWLEREAAKDIAMLRFIASSPGISRELWIHTPKGSFRFFRVLNKTLSELDRDGQPLQDQPRAPVRKSREVPTILAPIKETGEVPVALEPAGTLAGSPPSSLPDGTPESVGIPIVTVGENTPPDPTVGGTP
jgi:hypothetical protein